MYTIDGAMQMLYLWLQRHFAKVCKRISNFHISSSCIMYHHQLLQVTCIWMFTLSSRSFFQSSCVDPLSWWRRWFHERKKPSSKFKVEIKKGFATTIRQMIPTIVVGGCWWWFQTTKDDYLWRRLVDLLCLISAFFE